MASGCALLLFVPGALAWLGFRDQLELVSTEAVGRHGPWASLGLGLAVGLAIAGVLALLGRYLGPYRRLEGRLFKALGPVSDQWILFLSLATAVGEELFFRLAALDALGLWGAALVYAAVNTGPRLWLWTGIAVVLALVFGTMVAQGFGLLSATAAHAIASYLTLRRILLQ